MEKVHIEKSQDQDLEGLGEGSKEKSITKIVAIGTKNPCKIQAVTETLTLYQDFTQS